MSSKNSVAQLCEINPDRNKPIHHRLVAKCCLMQSQGHIRAAGRSKGEIDMLLPRQEGLEPGEGSQARL